MLFNSKVSRSGNLLTVTRANAGDALIGRTTGKVIPSSPYNQLVTFTMKHVAAKVKVQLTGYMRFSAGIAATLASVNATDVPSTSIYDASTGTWSLGTGAATTDNLTYGSSQPGAITPGLGRTSFIAASSEDAFFMPSTDVSKLKLTFTAGTIYNQNMTGANLTFAPKTPLQLDQNGSYVLNVDLMYRFLYLMSDGTRGFIDKTTFGGGTKTPIAVVVSQSRHMAVALENAGGANATYVWTSIPHQTSYGTWPSITQLWDLHNKTVINHDYDISFYVLENGNSVTWDAAESTNNTTIKGNDTRFPAFYAAGHYTPTLPTGVNLTGKMVGKKWYLAALGEWKYVCSALGFGETADLLTKKNMCRWQGTLAHAAFTQVGGTSIIAKKIYWSSTELRYLPKPTCCWGATVLDLSKPTALLGYFGRGRYEAVKELNQGYTVRPFIIYDE